MKTQDIHVMLPAGDVKKLDRVASESRRTRNAVIQQLLEEALDAREKARVAAAMKAYAESHGRHSLEFTKETESHVSERLLRDTEW